MTGVNGGIAEQSSLGAVLDAVSQPQRLEPPGNCHTRVAHQCGLLWINMHYYSFNIGDYASHTRNLSLMEDLAYRRLLDAYYLSERPLNGCSADVAREIGMREQVDAVDYVLNKFFDRFGDAWLNKRADAEIEHFASKKQQASNAGKASAERRLNARSTPVGKSLTDVQPTNNQEPITKNQETIKEETSRKRSPSLPCPDDVSTQVWDDWRQLRKTKKAPVTKTVLDGARGQAAIAGMTLENFLIVWCRRGSQGLEAAWLKPDERGCVQSSGETAYQRSMRERIEEVSPDIARKRPGEKAQSAVDFFRTVDVAATIVEMKELEARK